MKMLMSMRVYVGSVKGLSGGSGDGLLHGMPCISELLDNLNTGQLLFLHEDYACDEGDTTSSSQYIFLFCLSAVLLRYLAWLHLPSSSQPLTVAFLYT